jgi:hypothetical protein
MATIDDMSPIEFVRQMNDVFGARRTASLIGWCVIFGAIMREGETPHDLAERLKAAGYGQTAVYEAKRDIERFKLHLQETSIEPLTFGKVLDAIKTVGVAL